MSRQDIELLTTAEVAGLFRTDPKTVTRWANSGQLLTTKTLGGHHRYFGVEVRARLRGMPREQARALAEVQKALLTGGADGGS